MSAVQTQRKSRVDITTASVSKSALSYMDTGPLHLSFKPWLVTQSNLAELLSIAGRLLLTRPGSLCIFLPLFGERALNRSDRGSGH